MDVAPLYLLYNLDKYFWTSIISILQTAPRICQVVVRLTQRICISLRMHVQPRICEAVGYSRKTLHLRYLTRF